ncbi:ribosome small subunit-dependent GTPase A [Nocardia amamiensis]|uniref:Small ribosomal subunit biogenesis GTPase RsgA n=1 Tax=Nocardia amamiensis TaxID=404578 RepID=A0ABS0CP69_9NOCA|nr:ribosome small subunit-dependent GTPase A [Nocardia amamiensis]MBF6298341.1 ribosome small subunit-dependent GTPase A [Nocardia amamiensis]
MVDYDLLVPYGWTEAVSTRYASMIEEGCVPARIIRMDRSECDVATPSGLARARCPRADSEVSGLCTGDWVSIDSDSSVRRLLPRRSAIVRSSVSGRSQGQVLAANVDTVLICTAADGDVDLGRIERMLTLAWESNAQPIVLLTKSDAAAHLPLDEVRAVAPGAAVLAVSADTGTGLDVLVAMLAGTVALIGPSGAGKSTLANALLGAEIFATNAVRDADKKGRHTTVHRELRPLPGGGTLIDTPGLRGVGLWDATEGIEKTFSDIESLAAQCRFGDCAHRGEPGCAVRDAIDNGELTQRRLDSYRKLARENEWIQARTDKRLQAERERAWRDITKQHRKMFREKNSRR